MFLGKFSDYIPFFTPVLLKKLKISVPHMVNKGRPFFLYVTFVYHEDVLKLFREIKSGDELEKHQKLIKRNAAYQETIVNSINVSKLQEFDVSQYARKNREYAVGIVIAAYLPKLNEDEEPEEEETSEKNDEADDKKGVKNDKEVKKQIFLIEIPRGFTAVHLWIDNEGLRIIEKK